MTAHAARPRRIQAATFALLSLLLVAMPAWAQGRHDHRRPDRDAPVVLDADAGEQAQRQLARLERELAEMEQLIAQMRSERLSSELTMRVRRAQTIARNLDEATDTLIQQASVPVRDVRPRYGHAEPLPRGPVACDSADFARVLSFIQQETWDDGKMAILRDAAASRWFTAAQVRRVMQDFTFSAAKIEAGELLYRRTVDPENFFVVYDALTFSSDKSELRRRVQS